MLAASVSTSLTLWGLLAMSLAVASRPAPSLRVITPCAWSRSSALASLVASEGTAMVAPSGMLEREEDLPP